MPKKGENPASSGLMWYFSASSQNRSCSSVTFSGLPAARSGRSGERDPGQQQVAPGRGQAAGQLGRGAQVAERKTQQYLQLVGPGQLRGRRSGQDGAGRLDGGQRRTDLPAGGPDLGPVEQGEVFKVGPVTLRYG